MSSWELAVAVVALIGPALHVAAAAGARAQQRALVRLGPAPLTEPLLVVVPARNEAKRIGPTLAALLADPSPQLRVVVVDDRSDDGTADLVRAVTDARLSLLVLDDEPPAGTFGKPRALQQALAAHPEAATVAVVDADVVVVPGLLGALAAARRERQAAAVSGLPALDNQGFAEELLVPAFVAAVGVTHPPARVNAGQLGFLNGQLLLLDRAALDDVGGFAAVSGTVLEDVALARLLHARGHKLLLADLRGLARTRMYGSCADVVAGFGKNARALHGAALLPLAALVVTTSWLPWLSLAAALATGGAVDDVVAGCGLAVCAGLAMLNRVRIGSRPLFGLLSPLAQLVVAVVFVRAALVRRGTWRGRSFPT